MNQQSGMEADKEIDRFLQKVKKRDMRQKSILLLGMYALVGSILGFLVQCVAIWYPFYNCVPTSAAVFLGSIAVGGVHLFLCRTTTRRAARLADNMGMQERVSTSIEGRGSTDELRILQRIDTRDQLRNISLEKTMPYYIPWKRYVSLGVFLLMGFICLFIPSEAKDVAKQKHEFVKKVEKEQEKIAKAKKVLDKEMAKGKISKESRKKLEESIKTAQKDMKQARSVDEVTAAQKRLETKLLRDVPENISKEAADSLRPFVDGKNLQALSKYQKQLADLAGKQKAVAAVSDELKELGEQLSESKMKELMQQLNEKAQSGALTQQDISEVLRNLDNASASYTRSALLQDQTDSNAATQNQNTQAQIPAAGNVQTQTDTSTQVSNKKYLSKGWAVFWFIFTIIINAIISFWIGNRFYKLSKKDNHLSFEIRALRKDIEEKFVNNVGGFSEQEVDIKNLNESLALDDEGLKPTAKQPVLNEVSAEEEARFRRWEEAQSKPRKERVKPKSVLKEEFDEELDDVKKIKRKNYQPKRNPSEDFEDEKENEKSESVDMDATREIKLKGEGVKSKAKELLGDIFPFKED